MFLDDDFDLVFNLLISVLLINFLLGIGLGNGLLERPKSEALLLYFRPEQLNLLLLLFDVLLLLFILNVALDIEALFDRMLFFLHSPV